MIPASENRAALVPQSVLSRTQQSALMALHDYRQIKRVSNGWQLGPVRVSTSVVARLESLKLVIERRATFGATLSFTAAGTIAAQRLAELRRGKTQ
ncbi:hypothetical protein [Rhizobium sp. PL01]|uniref:hypothetical protein n=1 Tax=Rhizobium sp. PL01 TaxID=3085631 RepID=UPI0029811ACF|nr:hypothetical protein [Rhizobium sp. PL01]MDW5313759.1 hypothetical protein [Rhizobium sp. PL01]